MDRMLRVVATGLLLTSSFAILGSNTPVSAAPSDSDGDGKLEITTCDELFTELAGGTSSTPKAGDYELLPAGSTFDCTSGSPRSPMGYFSGLLDGNGVTLADLSISCSAHNCGLFETLSPGAQLTGITFADAVVAGPSNNFVGLLAGQSGASTSTTPVLVDDIAATRITVTGASYVGGLLGACWSCDVSAIDVDGSVTGDSTAGGVIGMFGSDTITGGFIGLQRISNSTSSATVTADDYVGGFVGLAFRGDFSLTSGIFDSTFDGSVAAVGQVGANQGGGGFIGQISGISGGGSTGGYRLERLSSLGSVSGVAHLGGIVGWARRRAQLVDSYSEGSISQSGGNGSFGAGGLIGNCDPPIDATVRNTGTIERSYSVSQITAGFRAGGLIAGGMTDLTDSFFRGSLTREVGSSDTSFGGVHARGRDATFLRTYAAVSATQAVGYGFAGDGQYSPAASKCTNSFWDQQASTRPYDPCANGSDEKITTDEMKTAATFTDAGWDFSCIDPVWAIDATINDGYPFLVGVGMGAGYTSAEEPVTIQRAGSGTLTSGQSETVTFTLCESSSSFSDSSITVTGGTLSNFSGSATSYSATFTPAPNSSGTASISVAAGSFTDGAGNDAGSSTALTIPFNTAPAPSLLSYASSSLSLTSGTAMTTLTPTVTGTVTSWSVSPTLPTGLTLNTATGAISGTPTTASSARTYTVTATNAGGFATATFSITVTAPVAGDTMSPVVFLYRNIHMLAPGETNTVMFVLLEQVTGFTISDITVTAGTLSNFQTLDRAAIDNSFTSPYEVVYSVTYTPPASSSGSATMSVAAGRFTDLAGNANLPSLPLTLWYNTVPRAPVTDSSGDQTRVSSGAGLVIEDDGVATAIPVVEADSKATLTDGVSSMAITLNERVRLNTGRVEAPPREVVEVSGSGFEPDTDVEVWVFSEPTLLGTVLVDEDGNFSAELDLPATLPVGDHTVQAEGRARGGVTKALAVGLTIENSYVFVPVEPGRVVDTRLSGSKIDDVTRFKIVDAPVLGDPTRTGDTIGVPAGTAAVAMNITVTGTETGGYVSVYPCANTDTAVPNTSNVNYGPDATVANSATMPLSDDGHICVKAVGTTHVLIDIAGTLANEVSPS